MSGPIVFIHGMADFSRSWYRLRPIVEEHGFDIDYFNYATFKNEVDLPDIANDLAEFMTGKNYNNVILMGHSQGGLIAEWYDHFLKGSRQIRKVITIATPFHGTFAALLNNSRFLKMMPFARRQLRQLAFCSPSMKRILRARIYQPSSTPYLGIGGFIGRYLGFDTDGVVPVVSAARNATYCFSTTPEGVTESFYAGLASLVLLKKNHLPASFLYNCRNKSSEFRGLLLKALKNNCLSGSTPRNYQSAIIGNSTLLNPFKSKYMETKLRRVDSLDGAYRALIGKKDDLVHVFGDAGLIFGNGEITYWLYDL